jgi:hypothetical protein
MFGSRPSTSNACFSVSSSNESSKAAFVFSGVKSSGATFSSPEEGASSAEGASAGGVNSGVSSASFRDVNKNYGQKGYRLLSNCCY